MAGVDGPKARAESVRGRKQSRSFTARVFGLATRIFVYYLIYLSIWKCPPGTETLDEDAPALCRPLRSALHPLVPYVAPVYEERVRPYVDKLAPLKEAAQPYAEKAADGFNAHVRPRAEAAAEWASLKVEPYTSKARESYDANVEPYRAHVAEQYSSHVAPVVSRASVGAASAYSQYVLPAQSAAGEHLGRAHAYAYEKVRPHAAVAYETGREHAQHHFSKLRAWFTANVLSKVSSFYGDKISPEIGRIRDKVMQRESLASSSAFSAGDAVTDAASASIKSVKSAVQSAVQSATSAGGSAAESVKSSSGASAKSAASSVSSAISSSVSSASSSIEPAASSASEDAASAAASAAAAAESVAAKILNDEPASRNGRPLNMEQWKDLVEKTTREAFATFLDDAELEKSRLTEEVHPEFTQLLRDLQSTAHNASVDLSALVNSIPEDASVEASAVQEAFRDYAEQIRVAALAVRIKAENFAHAVEEAVEEVRRSTVEILDEFADLTLQEMGRKMVSMDGMDSSAASSETPSWKDWKKFRAVKERLVESRQDIVDHQVQMSDVNKLLREAQQTANVLAQEAAQMMSGLRGKADYLLQERLRAAQRAQQEANVDEDLRVPDAEYYYELEDDDHEYDEPVVETRTITRTHTQTHSSGSPASTVTPDDDDNDDDDDQDDDDDDDN